MANKKKVILTGANGLLGQKLVHILAGHDNYELIATGKGDCRVTDVKNSYIYEEMDICNQDQVLNVFDKYQPDYCINTAAMTNVDQCETERDGCMELNVHAVSKLVKACEKHQSFFLHLSTDFIFDGEDGPYKEEDKANPISFYGESKLQAEDIVMSANIPWAIARTVLVYGITPNMSRSNIILWVKNSLENGKHIKVVNDQWRTPTLAEDLAMGCFLIIDKNAEGIFNISGKELLTPYEMAVQTIEFFGLDASLMEEVDGSIFKQVAKRPPRTGFDISKAEKILGYKPHSFKEGISILSGQLKSL